MERETNVDVQYFKNITDFRSYLEDNSYRYKKYKSNDKYVYSFTCRRHFVEQIFYPIANKLIDDNKNTWIDYVGIEREEFEDEYGYDCEHNVVIYEVGIDGYDESTIFLEFVA